MGDTFDWEAEERRTVDVWRRIVLTMTKGRGWSILIADRDRADGSLVAKVIHPGPPEVAGTLRTTYPYESWAFRPEGIDVAHAFLLNPSWKKALKLGEWGRDADAVGESIDQ